MASPKERPVRVQRDRRAMLKAIKSAAEPGLFVGASRTDGLRSIRLFEQLNGIPFNPRDRLHVLMVTNSAWHFAMNRKLRAIDLSRGEPG